MNSYFLVRLMPQQSLISMSMASGGKLPLHMARGLAEIANGRLIRAIRYFAEKT